MSKTHHTIISAANRACENGEGGGSNEIKDNAYCHNGNRDAQVNAPLSAERKFTKVRAADLSVRNSSKRNERALSPLVNISKLMEEQQQQQQKSVAPAQKKAPIINPNVSSNLSLVNKKYRYEEDKNQQDKATLSSDFQKTFAGGIYGQLLSNRYQSQRESCACDVCQALSVDKKSAKPSNKVGEAPQQPVVLVSCSKKNETVTQYTKNRYAALEKAYAKYLHRSQ